MTALLAATFLALAPLLLAALGGSICQWAGVFNVALEGMMLAGAFAAVAGSWYTNDPWLGVAAAVGAGTLLGTIIAVGTIYAKGNAIMLGIAVNLLSAGLTGYLIGPVFGTTGTFTSPQLKGLPAVSIPGIRSIPGIGPILSGQPVLVYVSVLLAVAMSVFLFRHPWGLRLRGVGHQPDAAAALGAQVSRYQWGAVFVSGALCGLAGAELSLGSVTLFTEGMTSGRGWIAVAAVMLGGARPVRVLGACVLFGFADALGSRLQGHGLPSQFTDMAPYLVTFAALILVSIRARRQQRMRAETEPERPAAHDALTTDIEVTPN
jgi:general nucleoside transport system permease protein